MRRFADLDYKLTEKVDIYGCGCKLEKLRLENLLSVTGIDVFSDPRVLAGVGDDAGVLKVSNEMVVVQHLDFFTPIVDEPYIQGKIAACNVSSDIFAKGVTNLIGALTILGVPSDMPDDSMQMIVRGFHDVCSSIAAPIVGGQTIYCAWPVIGGAMTGVSKPNRIVYNSTAKSGDALILTKPLGNRSVMAALRGSRRNQASRTKGIPQETISRAVDSAIQHMTTVNRKAAEAMMEVGVSAATDVTGFGILGHADTMARRSHVNLTIDTLPVIQGALQLARSYGHELEKGTSAETSGGLLISVPDRKLDSLSSRLERKGVPAYVVGRVEEGVGQARVVPHPRILEV